MFKRGLGGVDTRQASLERAPTLSAPSHPKTSAVARALLYVAVTGLILHIANAVVGFGGSGLAWLLDNSVIALLICAAGAGALMFSENRRLLLASREEARTDPLTGLGNRRRLMEDLTDAAQGVHHPYFLALFDLDGFKAYNDSFGHTAGDALLRRLAGNLAAAVSPEGLAYRLGGDEFCVLTPVRTGGGEPIAAASAALSEQGAGFAVRSSWGAVFVPDETDDAVEALSLADRRMYNQKSRRPRSPERQTRNVLLRALHERSPAIGDHLQGVAPLAVALGQAAHLSHAELDEIARASELHDIGKIGVPDGILRKRGPLNQAEWTLMRNHTLIGERILASAPAMAQVARLVRSTHERWDGTGYPDGLALEEIPLGSRVIAVCDAFIAMTQQRPWRATMSHDGALQELRNCAGTQFDPQLVETFCKKVYPDLYAEVLVPLEPDADVVGTRDVPGVVS
jgi:two-component system, cell cycle response regulator